MTHERDAALGADRPSSPATVRETVSSLPQSGQDTLPAVWYGGSRGVWKERRIRPALT